MNTSVSARVMEAKAIATSEGVGEVIRLVINLEGIRHNAYENAGLNIALEDQLHSPEPVWIEESYQVPFEHTFDIRLLIPCPARDATPFQKKVSNLKEGDLVKVSQPVRYPFYAPINDRGKLILLAAGCDVNIFRPLVKRIYSRDIEWMGEVRAYGGNQTGIDQVYLNRKNNDVLHYLDDGGYRAFNALMARSSATVARLEGLSGQQAAIEFVHFVRSPSTYAYVAGNQSVLDRLGETVDKHLQQSGAWQRIQQNLTQLGHWHTYLFSD